MGSRTKIIVLHMKEIIYTAIFAALGILLIILLVIMFRPGGESGQKNTEQQYTPGTYTSSLMLNNTNLEVEVSVDEDRISSIRFSNLDDTVQAMFHCFSLPSRILQNRYMRLSHWMTSPCRTKPRIPPRLYLTP